MIRLFVHTGLLAFMALSICTTAPAQEGLTQQWQKLIRAGKFEEAKPLCSGWLKSPDSLKKAEAHKCLANVVLSENTAPGIVVEGDDAGGGTIHADFLNSAVDEAVKHLDEALRLAPQDLSIHQGRLHLLEVSMRYGQMAKALDESCKIYRGEDAVSAWLAYPNELYENRHYRANISLLEILDQHYPNNHEVLGNIGADYNLLKEPDKAIEYFRRAVELAPNDPIDTWNLGRIYDFSNKTELADQWYQKALELNTDSERRRNMACLYAGFLETKLHDAKKVCGLQKANCEAKNQTACAEEK